MNATFDRVETTRDRREAGNALPPRGEPVIVRCLCFRCLGYRDDNGKWRGRYDGRELPEVLEWEPA